MQTPEILPADRRLDAQVALYFDELVSSLANHYEQHGTFVDPEAEAQNPALVSYINTVSGVLLRACTPTYDTPRDVDFDIAFRASYEAFFFAYRASEQVMPDSKPRIYAQDYSAGDSNEQKLEKIVNGGQDYLQQREHIDGLISWFIAELDPVVAYPQIAEAIASMTFSQIENGVREAYITEQTAEFSLQLAAFVTDLERE